MDDDVLMLDSAAKSQALALWRATLRVLGPCATGRSAQPAAGRAGPLAAAQAGACRALAGPPRRRGRVVLGRSGSVSHRPAVRRNPISETWRAFPQRYFAIVLSCRRTARAFGPRFLGRTLQRLSDVVLDQCLLGVLDGAFHRLELLGELRGRPSFADHLDDRFKMTIGTLEALDHIKMGIVRTSDTRSSPGDAAYPPGRIGWKCLTCVLGEPMCERCSSS